MENLEFYEKHNMVAFLKKPTRVKLRQTATVRAVDNEEQQIITIVDGKEFTITEASIRRHLQLANADDEAVYEEWDDSVERATATAASLDTAHDSGNILKTQSTIMPNVPFPQGIDEAVYEEWDDSVERATTTAASLDTAHDSGNILKTQSTTMPNVPFPQGIDMVLALETDLRQTKKVYGTAYTKLIMKLKKLEKTVKSNQTRRRTKIVVSDEEEDSEDSSKHGRMIEDIDQDTGITLVTPTKVNTYTRRRRAVSTGSEGVSTASRIFSTAEESVSTAGESMPVSTADVVQEGVKDKGKAIMQESEQPQKIKKRVQIQMSLDEELAQKFYEEEQARFNAEQEANFNGEQEQWINHGTLS
nr:hypothetical protein [Tanacetum cinerariifolium]